MNVTLESDNTSPAPPKTLIMDPPRLLDDFFYATGSDLGVLICIDSDGCCQEISRKGVFDIDNPLIPVHQEWMNFIMECREIIVQNSRGAAFFPSGFLHKKMKSSLICPIINEHSFYVLLLNSLQHNHYGKQFLKISDELTAKSIEEQRQFRQNESHDSNTDTEK